MLQSIGIPFEPYSFVDIGAGMGAAVLFASEFGFRRIGGIELDRDLMYIARRNTQIYNRATQRELVPDWVEGDFFKWQMPNEPQLFFMNNPFPESMTVDALRAIEDSLHANPRPALLVFRKAPKSAGDHLHRSTLWTPLRLAPYWRVYSATPSPATLARLGAIRDGRRVDK